MKLANFQRLDPDYEGVGLSAGGNNDALVWDEFAGDRSRLHEVARAIRLVAGDDRTRPVVEVQVDDEDAAPEGRILMRLHSSRERNASIIKRKKRAVFDQLGKLPCGACGFVFADHYDSIGADFIECHHIVPLSDFRRGQTTRLSDLALVCANCHRMLHRGASSLTIDELKEVVMQTRP